MALSVVSFFIIALFLGVQVVVGSDLVPKSPRSAAASTARNLIRSSSLLAGGYLLATSLPNPFALASSKYPIKGDEDIMTPKQHGTSDRAVQQKLRWGCDIALADRICNYNRKWAEYSGYWTRETSFLSEVDPTKETTFYDSVTGKPLFIAPRGRSFEEFKLESLGHGWPSFRDDEVVWENVRALRDGETVSLTGTHLGHNLPDGKGNRYCINLVSIAGYPDENA